MQKKNIKSNFINFFETKKIILRSKNRDFFKIILRNKFFKEFSQCFLILCFVITYD